MITIRCNGDKIALEEAPSLDHYLESMGCDKAGCFAIAINGKIIAKSLHAKTSLADGDVLDIIAPQPGG